VIANGMAFVLSAGTQRANFASLHVLDAITGKELYSGTTVSTGAAPSGGLALANGRVYFTGRDNAVYCFGIPAEQKQLIKQ
jgi:outer membrane protein assembly factor BamB